MKNLYIILHYIRPARRVLYIILHYILAVLWLAGCQSPPPSPLPPALPNVAAPLAIILPPPNTNAPVPVAITWTWNFNGATNPDGGYLVGYSTNWTTAYQTTNTTSNMLTLMVTNSASGYWYFSVAAIHGGVTSAWSHQARFPEWPPNMVKLSWDQFEAVSIQAYSNSIWSLVANVTNTNYFMRLNKNTNLLWYRIVATNPPPVNLKIKAFYDYRLDQ